MLKLSRAMDELSELLNHKRKDNFSLPESRTLARTFALAGRTDTRREIKKALPSKDKANVAVVEVKRACRIALMEVSGPAPLDELYTRIQHRGSCNFSGSSHPLLLLRRALVDLETEGEVQVITIGGKVCWHRTLGYDRVAFPHGLHAKLKPHRAQAAASE